LRMTFDGIDRPLEGYTRALCAAGFVIEALHEPRPSEQVVARIGELAGAAKRPYFLHLRCRLTGAG
jgi:hypothetical protein